MMRLVLHDLRLLARQRLVLVVLAVGLVASALAAVNGARWIDHLTQARSGFLERAAADESAYRARFVSDAWTDVDSANAPITTRRAFAYPVPLLADFSVGRSDVEPSMARVRMGYRSDMLFRNYQLDNPERLLRGRLDLAFIAVVVAPLLLIALGYGVFSADRDRGTAQLLLAQAGGMGRLLLARSVNRVPLVLLPLALAALALVAVGPQEDGRIAAAALWFAVTTAGLLFWWAVILLVNAMRVSAETAALVLVATWALLVLVAPPLVNAAARAAHPPPSRMAQIIDGRFAEQAATAAYRNDHPSDGTPELQRVKDVIAEYQRISMALEASIGPVAQRFDDQLQAQQTVVSRLAWLSPPMTVSAALAGIAGTDTASYHALRIASRQHLYRYTAALDRGIADNRLFTLADHDALPRFAPPPRPLPHFIGVGWTLLLALLFGWWASRRYAAVAVG
jgi:hypothetical protein